MILFFISFTLIRNAIHEQNKWNKIAKEKKIQHKNGEIIFQVNYFYLPFILNSMYGHKLDVTTKIDSISDLFNEKKIVFRFAYIPKMGISKILHILWFLTE